jgi:hypothetical protein
VARQGIELALLDAGGKELRGMAIGHPQAFIFPLHAPISTGAAYPSRSSLTARTKTFTKEPLRGRLDVPRIRIAMAGTPCDSCLEFSTLDRIIYNLLNNAARNAYDHVMQFHVLPIPRRETVENLRFVIANQVSGEHATRLNAAVPDLGQLFRSGFTTGGHGVGMSIVADFCMQAFGIYDDEKARKDG